ncbi:MAG: hypothetical protein IIU62_08210 [Alistipes sp.]|nr:hypothetical protein [Alistipes sp.]
MENLQKKAYFSITKSNETKTRTKSKKISESEAAKEELYALIAEILGEETEGLKLNTSPSVILVVGVNGVGKTTSIGKIANKLKNVLNLKAKLLQSSGRIFCHSKTFE